MKIEFIYSKIAQKFLSKQKGLQEKFEDNIYRFLHGDKNINIKRVEGVKQEVFRMRIESYRIIFLKKDGEIILIYTVDAGNRGDIYNNIKHIKKSLKNKD